jgi:hypothetical protein
VSAASAIGLEGSLVNDGQVVGRASLADDLDDLANPLLGSFLEELDISTLRLGIILRRGLAGETGGQQGHEQEPAVGPHRNNLGRWDAWAGVGSGDIQSIRTTEAHGTNTERRIRIDYSRLPCSYSLIRWLTRVSGKL